MLRLPVGQGIFLIQNGNAEKRDKSDPRRDAEVDSPKIEGKHPS